MKVRVADYIASFLEYQGVTTAFILSGGGMMHLIDALGKSPKLSYVCNHHEHACALSAQGYARKKNALGVCYATSGPGATNTVTGIAECWLDSVPVLFITGQSKLSQTIRGSGQKGLRQFGTFEVDIIPIVESITKYTAFLDDPKKIRFHLEKAIFLALEGRPGPVLIDIPVDLQGSLVDPDALSGYFPENKIVSSKENKNFEETIQHIIEKISLAKRPLILAGHGIQVSQSAKEFEVLAALLSIPIVTTPLATDILSHDNRFYIGHPGMKGDRAGNFAVQSADLILVLGSSLHVTTTGYELDQFAPQAYKIHVDPDLAILNREQVHVSQKLECSIQFFIEKMISCLSQHPLTLPSPEWLTQCHIWKNELSVLNEPHMSEPGKINYYDFIDVLSTLCREGDTIVTDAGSAFYVVGQAFRVKPNQRVITSGALGAMGHAIPLAIGACSANPHHNVIVVTGDGSLQTNIQELATVRQGQFNLKMFIINNDGYVSIRNTQNNFFNGHLVGTSQASGVWIPSLEKIAEAYEIPFRRAEKLSELGSVIEDVLSCNGPCLCEIITPNKQEILPMVSSLKRDDGSMVSKPLHDMYPFMDEPTFKRYMPFGDHQN